MLSLQVFVWTYVFISFGYIPGNGIAESYGLTIEQCLDCFLKYQYYFTFPQAVYEDFSISSTSLPPFVVVSLFDYSHASGCDVVSHCDFNLQFSSQKPYFQN